MSKADITVLDNPVWYALEQTHAQHVVDYGNIRFYRYPYASFGAIQYQDDINKNILDYALTVLPVIIVGQLPSLLPASWHVIKAAHCAQMICTDLIINEVSENNDEIIALDQSHRQALYDLIDLVQPGYFFEKTQELGQYFGIFKNDKLVAATGERLKLNNYTEISGVVTHPQYTKRGYATQLVAHTTAHVLSQNKTCFLHVLATNNTAISIYQKLGYSIRREMIWHVCGPKID
jgi:GNAT superfamily N-acetyltransferase